MTDWKNWSRGAVGAAINASISSASLIVVDPHDFNFEVAGLVKLAKMAIVSGLVGAILWMKQHENPWFEMSIGRNK
jgi:hypothetical protein